MQYSATPSQGDGDLEVQNREDANPLSAETSNYNIITRYGGSLLQSLHSNYNCSTLLYLALAQASIFSLHVWFGGMIFYYVDFVLMAPQMTLLYSS